MDNTMYGQMECKQKQRETVGVFLEPHSISFQPIVVLGWNQRREGALQSESSYCEQKGKSSE